MPTRAISPQRGPARSGHLKPSHPPYPEEARMSDGIARDQGNAPNKSAAEQSAALQTENADLRERMLRALADADNTRRRAERSAQDAGRYAVADFARELLPVVDNLERTINAATRGQPPTSDSALLAGVAATQRLLQHALEQFGIRKIDAKGAPFDPRLHEAMMEVADASQPPGVVVDVMEDGFTIHDRLLRPARVVVTQRSPPESSQAQTSGSDAGSGSRDASP
jgi:molecular chaperone GrpE